MGSLYRRGEIYWAKWYQNGKPIRQSTGTGKKKEADNFLKDREDHVAMGAPILPRMDRITFIEAADALRQHYSVTKARNLKDVDCKMKPIRTFFNGYRLISFTPSRHHCLYRETASGGRFERHGQPGAEIAWENATAGAGTGAAHAYSTYPYP